MLPATTQSLQPLLLLALPALIAVTTSTALARKAPSATFRSGCNEYDVAENLPEAMKSRQVVIRRNDHALGVARDQDGIGYCYSYAGADILEHWLKKSGQMPADEHVSALALGLRHDERRYDVESEDKTWRTRSVAGGMRATVRMQQRLEPLLIEARRSAKDLERQLQELRLKRDAA